MTAILRVEQLSKSFSGVRALEGVEVEIKEGEILGLIGPNGSGKTTLFNCVTGFLRPTSGRVLWLGENTTHLAPDQVARLGLVRTFQQKMVFANASVGENLAMAWQARRRGGRRRPFASCEDILELLELGEVRERTASEIPFGLTRKLGLGLALAAAPQLLLLDEPAAGLNPEEGADLARLIGKIRDLGVTVWIIEHNMPLIMSVAERIMVFHAGRKIAEGAPEQVAQDTGVISVYLGEKFAGGPRA